jgi:hypothetical protein
MTSTEVDIHIERIWDTGHRLFGGYRARVPELGLQACGASEDEATALLIERVRRYLLEHASDVKPPI